MGHLYKATGANDISRSSRSIPPVSVSKLDVFVGQDHINPLPASYDNL